MKDLKIGKLIFNKKAILLVAFVFFLNGMLIGGYAAYNHSKTENMNFMILFAGSMLTWITFVNPIKRNIVEVK